MNTNLPHAMVIDVDSPAPHWPAAMLRGMFVPPLHRTGRTLRRRLPANLGGRTEEVPIYHQFPRAVAKSIARGYENRA